MDWTTLLLGAFACVTLVICMAMWSLVRNNVIGLDLAKFEHDKQMREETLKDLRAMVKKGGGGPAAAAPVMLDLTQRGGHN